MAFKVECNKVYECQSPVFSAASIHVVSGSVKVYGSNVTEREENTGRLIIPDLSELVDTGDDPLAAGTISFVNSLPEWFAFIGDGEVWVKMGVDPRIEAGDKNASGV